MRSPSSLPSFHRHSVILLRRPKKWFGGVDGSYPKQLGVHNRDESMCRGLYGLLSHGPMWRVAPQPRLSGQLESQSSTRLTAPRRWRFYFLCFPGLTRPNVEPDLPTSNRDRQGTRPRASQPPSRTIGSFSRTVLILGSRDRNSRCRRSSKVRREVVGEALSFWLMKSVGG